MPAVRIMAADLLGRLGDSSSAPAIEPLLSRRGPRRARGCGARPDDVPALGGTGAG